MKRMIRPFLACLFILSFALQSAAFADSYKTGNQKKAYKYYVVSNEVYLEGKLQRGPSPKETDIILVLDHSTVKNGVKVDYYYFKNHYQGTVKDGCIIWDKLPYLVGDGKVTKTTIDSVHGGIILVFDFKMDYYKVTGKIFQALAPD